MLIFCSSTGVAVKAPSAVNITVIWTLPPTVIQIVTSMCEGIYEPAAVVQEHTVYVCAKG